ncbi:MerR family transcriptional regulator [Thalassomonas haliotis]|uniref:MerR family transcriptional regulator n=1 Tax=Thalassomonas haliotis TaxID=485448 RepID=A0ABY7VBA2_9GAMM|nr:MerR family transcriptional regulator [Thalassomonas haliotis]WDE10581.1 MerR family transcriptional regulator [Thalassomonas haliotis]
MKTPGLLTIGQLAKKFSISRTGLLYYHELGLLTASSRSAANYRLYNARDMEKLSRIMLYRSAGISLEEIKGLLAAPEDLMVAGFEKRLRQISEEMADLRGQQQVLARLLRQNNQQGFSSAMTKEKWSQMLTDAGLDEKGKHKWHRQYEQQAPESHRELLLSFGLSEQEVADIRRWSREE